MLRKIAEFLDLVEHGDEEEKKTSGKKVTIDEKEDKTVITIGSGPFRRVIRLHGTNETFGDSNREQLESSAKDVSVRARICGNLLTLLSSELTAKGLSFAAGLPIVYGEQHYTPDICLIGSKNVPDSVIEISENEELYEDMVDKISIYEKAGVKEYWVITIGSKSIISYCFMKKTVNIFTCGELAVMKSVETEGFPVEKIFAGI